MNPAKQRKLAIEKPEERADENDSSKCQRDIFNTLAQKTDDLLATASVLFGLPPDSCPKVLAASKLNSWAPTYVDRTKRLWDHSCKR